ncbi:MAG TPA: aldose epimerase family protein [Candidatus Aquilonibacter sp.]|nr:aldose epimerase family protein [Candidatus Aquilonibacter sp.]
MARTILPSYFGTIEPHVRIERYDLSSRSGFSISVLNYGATIVGMNAPDRYGRKQNVVLAYDDVRSYREKRWYLGATIGRFANRIAGGEFELDGKRYVLSTNEGGNTLHGGVRGFDKAVWEKVQSRQVDGIAELILRHVSPDGDQGFPGELETTVRFMVGPGSNFEIHYVARTTRPTIVNLTNHSYFNLSGDPARAIDTHRLQLRASRYTPVDESLIPTGEIAPVEGTRYDLRAGPPLGSFDTNFVLDRNGPGLAPAASLHDPYSGRMLDVYTTEPGIQVFSGRGDSVALETQHFPDSPHYVQFPSTVVRPDHPFTSVTAYFFRLDGMR